MNLYLLTGTGYNLSPDPAADSATVTIDQSNPPVGQDSDLSGGAPLASTSMAATMATMDMAAMAPAATPVLIWDSDAKVRNRQAVRRNGPMGHNVRQLVQRLCGRCLGQWRHCQVLRRERRRVLRCVAAPVTLSVPSGTQIYAKTIEFLATGYTLTGGTLSLSSSGTTVQVLGSSTKPIQATISSPISGTGLTVSASKGVGTLTLSGTNAVGGTVKVTAGATLQVGSLGALNGAAAPPARAWTSMPGSWTSTVSASA